jgi:hypothetical protein
MGIFGEKIDQKDHQDLVAAAVATALASYDMEGTQLTVDLYNESTTALAAVSADLATTKNALAMKLEEITALNGQVAELSQIPPGRSGQSKEGENGLEETEDRMALLDSLDHNKKADAMGFGA